MLHVDRAGGAHLARQREAVVVDVGDHHIARANVARDGGGHDADGAGACDQHVLAHQVERQRGMRGVAEGVEDGSDLVRDVVGNAKGVEGGNHQVLGKRAGAVHAHANRVAAQVAAPGAAVAAEAAGDVSLAGDAVANGQPAHLLPDGDDLADIFMPYLHRHGDGVLRPLVPFPDMDVGAADGRLPDADHHIVVADLRLGDVRQRQAGGAFEFGEGFHGVPPVSRLGSSLEAISKRFWRRCAALPYHLYCLRPRA